MFKSNFNLFQLGLIFSSFLWCQPKSFHPSIFSFQSKKGKDEAPKSLKSSKEKTQKNLKENSMIRSQAEFTNIEHDKLISSDIDEVLLQRPPTPPKPKVFLPPIDPTPFIKTKQGQAGYAPVLKDDEFVREQEKKRKSEVNDFMKFKEQMGKFREDEKKYRLYQKLKQIEECEILQVIWRNWKWKGLLNGCIKNPSFFVNLK